MNRFNIVWKTAESKSYAIHYIDFIGNPRNYFADFIINDKYLIECKPKKLWNSPTVLLKKNAAIDFCKKHNMIYKLVDAGKPSMHVVLQLVTCGDLIFMDKYKLKLQKYVQQSSN